MLVGSYLSSEEQKVNEHSLLGRRVVMKAIRKSKAGKDRNGKTGKLGILYISKEGQEVEQKRVRGPNAKDVLRQLRATGLIPTYVALKNNGETKF